MRLRLRQFRPRFGPVEYRVVQPWHPLRHTALADPDTYGYLVGDHDGLSRLAGLFSFAAYSRRTIVHVPLRNGVPLHGEERFIESCGGRVDLVLAHHSLGLRVSAWPRLRRRLTGGTPLTVRTDEHRTARDAAAWLRRSPHAGTRDRLRPVTYARTLFLVGSRDVFASAATEFEAAAGWGPRRKRVHRGDSAFVSTITYELERRPGDRRGPEFDIAFKAYPPYAHFRRPG
ncbi:hypothetical protein DPM19_04135 [Actinomadura craniellae]|uniref:Uncharacterized protein n=1 Tax=Actinomadura craniellae TaxID=2231787 RepID=A0A365HAF5_9ACTN|nr:hypothetical protein [Actinomadura craniellae]RAY16120.1 hypothetical protein DPM19_04135 [Actinomadura craniellae]